MPRVSVLSTLTPFSYIYHGKIVLPPEYPMKPPRKKISLSISGHHPETWQPSWSIRTALLAIIGFMPTKGEGAIDSLDYTPEERKTLAKKSQEFCCEACGVNMKAALLPVISASSADDREARELSNTQAVRATNASRSPRPRRALQPQRLVPASPGLIQVQPHGVNGSNTGALYLLSC
uniref:UBC core domain-containing protein n=1 Tax=Leptobrachium leishanense TaxID=445787 RepID=A0A8C5PXP8_9ANUR